MKNHYPFMFLGIASIVLIALAGIFSSPKNVAQADSNIPNWIQSMSTSSANTITSASQQVVATSTARTLMILTNDGNNAIYLGFNGQAAVAHSGLLLASSTSFTLDNSKLYTGAISAITAAGTAVLTVVGKQ